MCRLTATLPKVFLLIGYHGCVINFTLLGYISSAFRSLGQNAPMQRSSRMIISGSFRAPLVQASSCGFLWPSLGHRGAALSQIGCTLSPLALGFYLPLSELLGCASMLSSLMAPVCASMMIRKLATPCAFGESSILCSGTGPSRMLSWHGLLTSIFALAMWYLPPLVIMCLMPRVQLVIMFTKCC